MSIIGSEGAGEESYPGPAPDVADSLTFDVGVDATLTHPSSPRPRVIEIRSSALADR
jgi:hypothetical protein